MRKILAIALAVAMVMSMAAVSFAGIGAKSGTWATHDDGIRDVGDIYRYDSDADELTLINGLSSARYGSSVYIPLLNPDDASVTKYDMVEGLKIKAKWELNGDLVDSMKLAKRYTTASATVDTDGWYLVDADHDGDATTATGLTAGNAEGKILTAPLSQVYVVADSVTTPTFKGYLNEMDTKDGATYVVTSKGEYTAGAATKQALVQYYKADNAQASVYGNLADSVGNVTVANIKDIKPFSAYVYYIELALKNSTATTDKDVIGTITLNKSKAADGTNGTKAKLKDAKFDIAFNVSYKNNYLNLEEAAKINGSQDTALKPDNAYLMKFDSDDVQDIVFGIPGTENEGTFTVDVSGQGKLLMYFTTDANEAVVAANPAANVRFLNFNNAATGKNINFNRTGEFVYEWEDVQHVYEIVTKADGSIELTTPPYARYDSADEAVYFNTRSLGNYVFSDVELTMGEVAPEVEEVPEEVVSNPETGGKK